MRTMTDPIRRMERVSTGSVDIHPEHAYGSSAPTFWWILTSKDWVTGLPINVYVIEHQDGLVVFDTGQDRVSVTDPGYFPSGPLGVIYDRLARFEISPDDTLPAQLARLGYSADDVDLAIVSHLHQDHIGGLGDLPNARILVSAAEHRTLFSPMAEANGVLRSHLDFPAERWMPVDFEALAGVPGFDRGYDVFADGSVVLLPTPGHTPGSSSLLVRRPGVSPALLVGDLTYDAARMLEDGTTPGVGSRRALSDSTERVRRLASAFDGTRVLAAHDPATIDVAVGGSAR